MKRKLIRHYCIVSVILYFWMAVWLSIPVLASGDISASFTDPVFKQQIWEWLGNPKGSTPGVFTHEDLMARMEHKMFSLYLGAGPEKIHSLAGVENFQGTGLTKLFCDQNEITYIPTLPDSLEIFWCSWNQLQSLPKLPPGLKELNCFHNNLSILPDLPDTLHWINCGHNQLTSLPRLPGSLEYLDCAENQISRLPELPHGLTQLTCVYNHLVDLPDLPSSLKSFACFQNYIDIYSGPLQAKIAAYQGFKQVDYQMGYVYRGSGKQIAIGASYQLQEGELHTKYNSGQGWTVIDIPVPKLSEFTYYSSDPSVATVSAAGLITGKSAGSCNIFALFAGLDTDLCKAFIPVSVGGGGSKPGKSTLTATQVASPTIIVNGQPLTGDAPAIIENGSTLVPMRAIFQALGASVEWNAASQTVTAQKGTTRVVLTIGSSNVSVNDEKITLSVPARIIDGHTMVPLRFIGNALGAEVNWDDTTRTITVKG